MPCESVPCPAGNRLARIVINSKGIDPTACVRYRFAMGVTTGEQFDLITDDPRIASSPGMLSELREFYQASKDLRGLLTQAQAAKILDVPSGQINTWVRRGRLSSRVVAEVRMVSAGEVLALHKERNETGMHSGGRGLKAPALSDLVSAAFEDVFEDGK